MSSSKLRSPAVAAGSPPGRHKTPLSNALNTTFQNSTRGENAYGQANYMGQIRRHQSRNSMRSKVIANRDLSNLDGSSHAAGMRYGGFGGGRVKRKVITPAQVKELLMPVQRSTGSRVFGDKLEDYQELCKQLGDFKLSRVKANELNIMARGGANVIQAHLNLVKKSAAHPAQQAAEQNRAATELQKKGKQSTTNLGPSAQLTGQSDIENLVTSGSAPAVDLPRLVAWLNENQHNIQSKNHLRNERNKFAVTQST